MSEGPFQRLRRFFAELKRRKVYRVAATYAVVGFVLIQIADLTFVRLGLPSWTVTLVIGLVAVGFPLVLVGAWAFEMTPEGMRRTPEAEPVEAAEVPEGGTRTAYKVLVGLGVVAAAVAGGWYLIGGGGEAPDVTEGTVAVLPFQVSGSGADTWRDGMVTMLTTKLDGAGGLRAIPDRSVLAAWEDGRPSDGGAGTDEALGVARKLGAQFAVVGSAVQLGEELQLTAGVHATRSGDRLGQVEATGSPDSITALTDSLARRTLGVLAQQMDGGIRSADLASLTTRSLPALQSYLQGERHFRAGRYEDAVRAYRQAIDQDSTFALAHTRVSYAVMWSEGMGSVAPALRSAARYAERLPVREQRLLRARGLLFVEARTLAAVDTLRALSEDYPEDPRVWYSLGEAFFHGGIPGGRPEAERAFERAVELEPGVSVYHIHLMDLAMSIHHDSALAARRIAAYPGEYSAIYQTFWDLNFGSAELRRSAWSRLDSLPPSRTADYAWDALAHPTDRELQEEIVEAVSDQQRQSYDFAPPSSVLAEVLLERGKIREALRLGASQRIVAASLTLDYPIPDSALRPLLEPSRLPDDATPDRLMYTGLYLLEQGRGEELSDLIARLQRTSPGEGPEPWVAAPADVLMNELQGYRAREKRNPAKAARLWSRSKPWYVLSVHSAIWRGDLYRERGQLEKAEEWYMAAWRHPVAHERLGQLYEEMSRPKEATAAYRRFIAAWEDADPELQPRVQAARERLKELTAAEADADD